MTETTIHEGAVSEIEARANAATKGPWHTAKRRPALVIAADKARVADCHVGIGMAVDEAQINSEFIAHAREDIPALCATVKHLRAENETLRAADYSALTSDADDFRARAIQLCKDKAAEYERAMRNRQTREAFTKTYADAANEIREALEAQ